MLDNYLEEYQAFLRRLVQARLNSGLSQAEVAGYLGETEVYVQECETGVHRVDITEAVKFGFINGKELEYFIEL